MRNTEDKNMKSIVECFKKLRKFQIALIATGVAAIGAVITFAVMLYMNEYYIEFNVADKVQYEMEYGATEEIPAVSALYKGTIFYKDGIPVEVSVEGQVEYDKVGSYEITYSAQHEKIMNTISATVVIKDTQAPVITLVSNPEHYTSPVAKYEEEGFTATDNYDGDITSNVTSEEVDGKVIYKVADSSGNETIVEREIIYKDVIAPVLSLKGYQSVSLYVGGGYSEAGYSASDECDGDITGNVVVEGNVNTQIPGTYTVTYRVADSSGNVTEAKRTVTVKKPIPATGDKVIYLTFDDGPGAHTARLLDILDKYNVKVTFFVTNQFSGYQNMIGEAYRRGHTIAIHTYSHRYQNIYSSVDAYLADFNAIKDIVVAQTGEEPWLFRFPGGTSNTISRKHCHGIMTTLAHEMLNRGYVYCDWNVSSGDASGHASEQSVINNVINGIAGKNTAIVLQHDIHGYSVSAVDDIIEWGINNGYVFKAMTKDSPVVQFRPQN